MATIKVSAIHTTTMLFVTTIGWMVANSLLANAFLVKVQAFTVVVANHHTASGSAGPRHHQLHVPGPLLLLKQQRQGLSSSFLSSSPHHSSPLLQSPLVVEVEVEAATGRRKVLQRTTLAVLWGIFLPLLHDRPHAAQAAYVTDPHQAPRVATADNIPSFVQGTVTVPSGFDMDAILEQMTFTDKDPLFPNSNAQQINVPALYITARPDRPDNVPRAILEGSRGKPPPVLSARYERPTFPFSFQLTDQDYTLEGQPTTTAAAADQNSATTAEPWWRQDNLIVSARLDMDGIAATRSPEDLVGRAMYVAKQGGDSIDIPLTGRGAFGKFATGKK